MAFQFPWTNLHELNLDWFLSKFKQFTNNYLETTATVELIPTTEQPEVTVTGGTLDDDTDIVDPFTFNFKLPINSSGGGAVNSVNGKVGDVVLDKTDIGLGNVENVAQYSASNPPPYPVTSVNGMTGDVIVSGGGGGDVLSVNGKTGAVVLDKTDIGLGNVANEAQYSANNPPPYPVTSVNGQTGTVIIPGALYLTSVTCSAMTGDFASVNNTSITADHVVAECVFANQSHIASDVTWTTANGSLVLNGTCSSATTANIVLVKQ